MPVVWQCTDEGWGLMKGCAGKERVRQGTGSEGGRSWKEGCWNSSFGILSESSTTLKVGNFHPVHRADLNLAQTPSSSHCRCRGRRRCRRCWMLCETAWVKQQVLHILSEGILLVFRDCDQQCFETCWAKLWPLNQTIHMMMSAISLRLILRKLLS